jgi:hypothetical protein
MGFFKDTLSPGMLLLITATMREGKSNVASFLIEMGIPLGYNFYTNLLFFPYEQIAEAIKQGILKQRMEWYRRVPPEVHTVISMSQLILGLYNTRKNITILDEALLIAGSKKGVSKDIRWFEGFITQTGKLDSATVLIAQAKSKLATLLKEDIPTYEIKVHKISFDNRYVEIWFNPPQSDEDAEDSIKVSRWNNIPPSHYPYDHLAPAGFDFDLDIEEFINRISKLNSLQVRKQVPIIVKEMTDMEKPKVTKKGLIINEFYNDTNLSLKGIAKKYNASYNYVRQLHTEFLQEIK